MIVSRDKMALSPDRAMKIGTHEDVPESHESQGGRQDVIDASPEYQGKLEQDAVMEEAESPEEFQGDGEEGETGKEVMQEQEVSEAEISRVDSTAITNSFVQVDKGKPTLVAFNKSAFSEKQNFAESFPFTRGVKYSPDGLCVLTNSSDNHIRIFETTITSICDQELTPCLTMKEGELIYDFCWYPIMDSSQPVTCCLATTAQYQPIHLYDAYNGQIRASYRCFNHLDELVAARSVAFDVHGHKLYAGLKNEIRVFDVSVPGRDHLAARKTWTKKEGGQAGIVSCIATNPYLDTVYAVGTFSNSVGVYLEPQGQSLCILSGQSGGITHLQFTPDGSKLLAGGRKDGEILVWDMRNPGELYCILRRETDTNQRIYFDVHPSNGNLVSSGSTSGIVRVWDISQPPSSNDTTEGQVLSPIWTADDLHRDCINGVSFHPKEAVLVTSSGQRHFDRTDIMSDDEEEDVEEATEDKRTTTTIDKFDCSLKVWKF